MIVGGHRMISGGRRHVTQAHPKKRMMMTKHPDFTSCNVHTTFFLCPIACFIYTLSLTQSPKMYKTAIRAAPRRILSSRTQFTTGSSRRFLSTAPPSRKSRSWKSSAARWGLAAVGVYYYNTSNVFAEEPEGLPLCEWESTES